MKPWNLSGELEVSGKKLNVKDTAVGALQAVYPEELNVGLGDKLFRQDLTRKITEATDLQSVSLTLAEALTIIDRVHKQYQNAAIVGYFYDLFHNAIDDED